MGSTTALTNEQGEITDSYTYQAFREIDGQAGETENSYRFAGEQYDAELGDYCLRDHCYDQESGRFTRRDVYEGRMSEPLSLHKYMYAHNNSVDYTNPTGYFSIGDVLSTVALLDILAAIRMTPAAYNGRLGEGLFDLNFPGSHTPQLAAVCRTAWTLLSEAK